MPHVSKNLLPEKTWQVLWQKLIQVLHQTQSKVNHEILLHGLLTETEQLMLAKRLMVGLLINSSWEISSISQTLNMSTSTVYRIAQEVKLNKPYQKLLHHLLPQSIPFNKDTPIKSLIDFFFNEVFVSKTERYRRIKRI